MTKIYISVLQRKFKKKLSDFHHKKNCFLAEVKKKFATNKISTPPPPHISNGVSLTPERLNYVTVFSVKAVLPWDLKFKYNADCLISFSNIVT